MAELAEMTFKSKTGKILKIRSLTTADAAEFANFRRHIAAESTHTYNYVGMAIDETAMAKLIEARRLDPKSVNVGVFHEALMVGYTNIRPVIPDHPWVQHLAEFAMMIREPYWQEGIARKLLEIQEDFARSIGIVRIEAKVRSANPRGISLYKRNGFSVEGTRKAAALIDGKFEDEFHIAKILKSETLKWQPPRLETDRLVIRAITVEDAQDIFDYCKNPNVSRYTLWEPHASVKATSDFILDYILPNYQKASIEPLGIARKENPNKIIGTVGCFWASEKNQTMELAYALAESEWGQGLIAEASRAVIKYCFENYPVYRIQARAKKENAGSTRVMQKIGMDFEGTMKAAVFHRNKHWDMDIYSLVRPSVIK